MLNLSIAMLQLLLLFSFLFQGQAVSITSPQSGATLRGQVQILGTMNVPNFQSAELDFGYSSDSTGTWFALQTFPQPIIDAPFLTWDTTSITDGNYNLRLRVYLQDGSVQDVTVANLQIRNDVAQPTQTPEQAVQSISQAATATNIPATPTLWMFPQPTPLPPNPASLTAPLVYSTITRGAVIALVLFAVFSFLLQVRKD